MTPRAGSSDRRSRLPDRWILAIRRIPDRPAPAKSGSEIRVSCRSPAWAPAGQSVPARRRRPALAFALAFGAALWPWGLAAGRAGPASRDPDRSCWIRSRRAAARSNSSFSAASSISASRASRYSSVASVASSRPTALRTIGLGLDLLLDPAADRLDDRLGRDPVLGVVGELELPPAAGSRRWPAASSCVTLSA